MKKELAIIVATHMNKVNKEVEIERMAKVLVKNMSVRELQLIIKRHGL